MQHAEPEMGQMLYQHCQQSTSKCIGKNDNNVEKLQSKRVVVVPQVVCAALLCHLDNWQRIALQRIITITKTADPM